MATGKDPVLHVVCVATCTVPELAYLLISADRMGVRPVLLGLGDSRISFSKREYHVKLEHVRNFLRRGLADGSLGPDDLVLHVDAFDVLLRGTAADIVAGWRRAGSPPVLLSGERNLAPRMSKVLEPCFKAANPHSADKFINSGTYLGLAQHLHRFMSVDPMDRPGNDQFLMQQAWCNLVSQPQRPEGGQGSPWPVPQLLPSDVRIGTKRSVFYIPLWDSWPVVLADHAQATRAPVVHCAGPAARKTLAMLFAHMFPDALQPDVDPTYWSLRKQQQDAEAGAGPHDATAATGTGTGTGRPLAVLGPASAPAPPAKSEAFRTATIALGCVAGACIVVIVGLAIAMAARHP